ncbi:MAG: 3-phosphoshikimate 1-carboxyvinyltransferase [Lachnospiraceae bacterium]|nr:3-phosphoshikimate 1-carboxyvinyltransferase [Lachnospiraceae bacterium]
MIEKVTSLKGEIQIPGDKSISHRGIMLGSIAEGITELNGFLDGADCRSTISCFQKLGIVIQKEVDHVVIHGKGLHGLTAPTEVLDTGNSGTTTRIISGILCAQNFTSHINGDASIQKRPMKRIIRPLQEMGACIYSDLGNDCAPLTIKGTALHPIHYSSPVASAQVKSAILLAGLFTEGETSVTEPILSRNHTELMINGFGGEVTSIGTCATIKGLTELHGQKIAIPGDISSAAYFIVAGLLCKNAELLIKNVNTNPTRAGILKVVKRMGGNMKLLNERVISGEPVADILVQTSNMHGITIDKELIPSLIDEVPVIAVLASQAEGQTIIKDAAELKVKESNRIDTVCENLRAMGCHITPTEDGMIIEGNQTLHGTRIQTHLDHRIAMAFAIAGLIAEGETTFDHPECIEISYPTFFETIEKIQNK